RVHLAADRVHLRRELQGGALAGALEQQVLKVVGGAGVELVLVPGPDAHPDAKRYRPDGRQGLGDHAQAARKDGPAHGRLRSAHLVAVPAARALPGTAVTVAAAALAVTVRAVAAVGPD